LEIDLAKRFKLGPESVSQETFLGKLRSKLEAIANDLHHGRYTALDNLNLSEFLHAGSASA
jgi:hypothetical protein